MQRDINELYNALLAGELGRLEEQRKEFVRSFNRLLWIFYAVCCAFLIVGSVTGPGVHMAALGALIGGCAVLDGK